MSAVSWRDGWHMRRTRADYYTYLGDLLGVLAGRRSLADVFADDARRYGPATARGRVAAIWCDRLEETGGDLARTWSHSFPAADLALIELAQHAGSHALAMHPIWVWTPEYCLARCATIQCSTFEGLARVRLLRTV